MTQPIIFLDIDGVLTTHATRYRSGDPLCVARLNRIADATGAAIVVSSSWRGHSDIAGILAGWGVTGQVVGVTPDLRRQSPTGRIQIAVERGEEIYKWLVDAKHAGQYVILDDEADMGPVINRLIRTDTQLGLRDADANSAIALLNGERV